MKKKENKFSLKSRIFSLLLHSIANSLSLWPTTESIKLNKHAAPTNSHLSKEFIASAKIYRKIENFSYFCLSIKNTSFVTWLCAQNLCKFIRKLFFILFDDDREMSRLYNYRVVNLIYIWHDRSMSQSIKVWWNRTCTFFFRALKISQIITNFTFGIYVHTQSMLLSITLQRHRRVERCQFPCNHFRDAN